VLVCLYWIAQVRRYQIVDMQVRDFGWRRTLRTNLMAMAQVRRYQIVDMQVRDFGWRRTLGTNYKCDRVIRTRKPGGNFLSLAFGFFWPRGYFSPLLGFQ